MAGENDPVVVARDLVKSYNGFTAVNGISFEVRRGEILGFLGPNGAGKSSTIRMMYGFISVTSGTLHVLGHDVATDARRAKEQLGVVPQEENLDRDLGVREQLFAYARYFRIPREKAAQRVSQLIEFAQLEGREKALPETLSGGMKRRLLIARALLNQPRLLILDEPTTGLDPQARVAIWLKLRQLREEGMTILLTTHYMEEAEKLADRLILMNEGRIVAEGQAADLTQSHTGSDIAELRFRAGDMDEKVNQLPPATEYHLFGDTLYVYLSKGYFTAMSRRDAELQLEDLSPLEIYRRPASLEDVFLKVAGKSLRD